MTIEALTLGDILKNPRARLEDLEKLSDEELEKILEPYLIHTKPSKEPIKKKPSISIKKKSKEEEVNEMLKQLGLPSV